ncbi:MAG: cytochrome c biogenesis protein CcsA [Bacteroidales bacterium]|nr:cytochrome c biogenesis protein CcsA [Bacteroidales bacterium]
MGLTLQLTMGPIDWTLFARPVNWIILVLLLGFLVLMFLLRKKVYAFEWMMHGQAAVASIAWALGITLVMGLIPQSKGVGVPWLSQMLTFWPFVLIWTWMMVVSGLATLNHLLRFNLKEIPFLLNHLGVFVAIVAATLGSADMQKLQMKVAYEAPEWRAFSDDFEVVEPGFTLELHQFTVDYYEHMTPKRFASDISVYTVDGQNIRGTVEVNKPLKVNGWKIYQYGYDSTLGSESPYSVFLLVKDPWLPAVYAGILLMLTGALAQLFTRRFRRWGKRSYILPLCLILATVAFVYFFTPVFRNKALMPALQSPWFVPHVVVYMFSYAILAAATLMALYLLFFHRHARLDTPRHARLDRASPEDELTLTDNLVYIGLAFLTIGMLFGALWAKEAWGHYWAWDPKETWAAITWLCYLLYLHFRTIRPKEWRKACWILLLAFVCLQICWWGINYLPSAQGLSIHTYNVN